MPQLKEGYPYKLSSVQIKEEIEKISLFMIGGPYADAKWISAANQMFQSGKVELADRFAKRSFIMMLGLTLISVIAAGVSIWYAFHTDKNDADWKSQEIQVLEQIQTNTAN